MSSKEQRIKMLERSLRVALSNAVAAQKRLAAAVEEGGDDVFIPWFLMAERHRKIVRSMRADHRAELAEKDRAIMVGTLLHTGAQPTPEALAQFPQLRDVFMEVAAIKRGAELMMMIKSRDKREEVVNDIIKQSGARSSRRKKE